MDRQDLQDRLDGVLAALTRRASDDTRLAPDIVYTENAQRLAPGDGLWATADRIGTYRHDFHDSEAGQSGCFTTVFEGATHSILFLRLRVEADLVTEIETLVARPGLGGGGPFAEGASELDRSGAHDPHWDAPVRSSERADREALARAANRYFSGLECNDGLGDYNFADDCIRIENGYRTTDVSAGEDAGGQTPYAEEFRALSARAQFETGFFRFVDAIRDRRFPIIDRERGCVVALAFFDHSGTVREYDLTDETRISGAISRPFTWQVAEAFRIESGQLRRIEALMSEVPYRLPTAWLPPGCPKPRDRSAPRPNLPNGRQARMGDWPE